MRLAEFALDESPAAAASGAGALARALSDWLLSESSLGMGDGGITVTFGFKEEVSERLWLSWLLVEVVTGLAIVGVVMDMDGFRETEADEDRE